MKKVKANYYRKPKIGSKEWFDEADKRLDDAMDKESSETLEKFIQEHREYQEAYEKKVKYYEEMIKGMKEKIKNGVPTNLEIKHPELVEALRRMKLNNDYEDFPFPDEWRPMP